MKKTTKLQDLSFRKLVDELNAKWEATYEPASPSYTIEEKEINEGKGIGRRPSE